MGNLRSDTHQPTRLLYRLLPERVKTKRWSASLLPDLPLRFNQVQSVVCFDRPTGNSLWATAIHEGNFERRTYKKPRGTHAAGTVACDGQRVYVAFLNNQAIWTTALDLEGEILWQTKVSDFRSKFGYGASPAIYKSFVIVMADNSGSSALAAINRMTGEIAWKIDRSADDSYASPAILKVAGKDQLLLSGCDRVIGYDPSDGSELWSVKGSTRVNGNFSASPVLASGNIFTTSERGKTVVFKASPDEFELVAENQLGDEAFASPTICSGRIYLRVADSSSGKRQESLYCIGSPDPE